VTGSSSFFNQIGFDSSTKAICNFTAKLGLNIIDNFQIYAKYILSSSSAINGNYTSNLSFGFGITPTIQKRAGTTN
jgi:hypothetical protein